MRQIVLLRCQVRLSALAMLLIELVSAFFYRLDSRLLFEDIVEAQSFKRQEIERAKLIGKEKVYAFRTRVEWPRYPSDKLLMRIILFSTVPRIAAVLSRCAVLVEWYDNWRCQGFFCMARSVCHAGVSAPGI